MTAAQQIILAALVIAAAVFDLRTRRIPNWLCTAGPLWGVACQIVRFQCSGARGTGLALLIYVPLFALRAVGGGDVKLMAAVGSIRRSEILDRDFFDHGDCRRRAEPAGHCATWESY